MKSARCILIQEEARFYELPQAITKIKTSLSEQITDTGAEREERNRWKEGKGRSKWEAGSDPPLEAQNPGINHVISTL